MRFLVTGAFGFLGLALIRRLAREHTVVATGHPPRVAAARATIPDSVTAVEADLEDIAAVIAANHPLDGIVHLAGGGGAAHVEADPVRAVRTNVRGTSLLVAAARAAGVPRVVYASSIAVYGATRDMGRPYTEQDPTAPDDLYGALKEAAEHIVTSQGGVALRLANLYGAGCGVDLGIQGVAERFARAAAASEELGLYAGGAQKIDLLHVDDAAAAFEATLAAARPPSVMNVGGGSPITIGALASACLGGALKIATSPRIVAREPPPGPRKVWPDRSLSIGLASNSLGWRPRTRLQQGIDAMVRMMAGLP